MKPIKLLQIAVEGNTGSTGTIAETIGELAMSRGWDSYIAHGRFPRPSKSKIIKIGNNLDVILHGIETRLFDNHGFGSRRATRLFIEELKIIKPDIIHLHHLHGYYINIQMLFDYLLTANIPVIWTFHDCWSFTGHCAHFDFVGCDKWKTECHHCPQKKEYPASWLLDRSKQNFNKKRKLFTSIPNLLIITVSKWLENLVKESFFKNTDVFTIHNGIDVNVFKPQENIRETLLKYKIDDKFLILGVATTWGKRKGFDDFLKLSKSLKPDEVVILVGLNKDEIKQLPANIIGLERTDNKRQLVDLYSAADIFMNLSVEETFGLTTAESLSCGTPVVVYNATASPEIINLDTGIIVEKNSIKGLILAIKEIKLNGKGFYAEKCRARAVKKYSKDIQYVKYFEAYNTLLINKKEESE